MKRNLSSLTRLSALIAAAAAFVGTISVQQAHAEFPEKPVEMTVLFGGSAQTIAQMLADLMSKRLDQPVVAVSRTGGGGAVGYTYVHGTEPDGYNIVWNSNSVSTAHHFGNMDLTHEAFVPIARVSLEVPVMAVRKDRQWETLQDMVDWSKETGETLRIGHAGVGSFTHLTSAALFDRLGIEVNFIPYGQGREVAELLAGRIDAAMRWPSEFISHIEAGTLHPICVTGAERVPVLPDTPSCAEAGAEGLNLTMWRGLAAPAGTPQEVIEKLGEAARAAAEDPAFQDLAEKIGFQPAFLPAEEFAEVIATDDEVISGIVAEIKE